MELLFEWDIQKEETNIRKHGLDFETAKLVFLDENRLEILDETHDLEEERYITIGRVHAVLFVVYTMRKNVHRIISARVATKREERIYYGE